MREEDAREVQVTCYCFGRARKSHLTLGEIKSIPPPFIMVCPCGSGASKFKPLPASRTTYSTTSTVFRGSTR
jgi:hypothetical protein